MKLRNRYFILRHGETIYQKENKELTYPWPENPPIKLTREGVKAIESIAKKVKKEHINFIYSSDIFRTRQTANIVAKELGLKINLDKRLRDINLGTYHNGLKKDFYQAFPDSKKRFSKGPKNGESWNDVKKRIKSFLKDIEKRYRDKVILIISHGDPLWLLEGMIRGLNNQEFLDEILVKDNYIKTGELRTL